MREDGMTTTQIFRDEHGNFNTRIWYVEKEDGRLVQKMRIEPTDPSQIRPVRNSSLFEPESVRLSNSI